MSTSGMDRYEMYIYLESLGFNVPIYGILNDFRKLKKDINKVVVHLDLKSHRGENKILLDYEEALEKYRGKFATEYIETDGEFGVSYRYLRIGDEAFWLLYKSKNDWRSNCGSDIKIDILEIEKNTPPVIKSPLYAIDLVFDKYNNYHAIDFNISPGIKGTGVEDILKPKEVVDKIKETILYFRSR